MTASLGALWREPPAITRKRLSDKKVRHADTINPHLRRNPVKRSIVTFVALAVLTAACSSAPAELAGYVRTPAPNSATISLPDATAGGEEFFLKAADERLLLVYFGYTACPDVCPTTLADIRTALRDLGSGADQVDLAMITVDPDRDTDEIMAAYVQSFIPEAHGLRTQDPDVLADAGFVLGAAYNVAENDEGVIEVLHTAHVYVIDAAGDLLITWPFGMEPSDMTSDLRILLDQ
jgi:protein SCO1/2